MRNKILDSVIENVIEECNQSSEFKVTFKSYVRNKFSGNASDDDLKAVLKQIDVPENVEVSLNENAHR